jgi:hypothetical protein
MTVGVTALSKLGHYQFTQNMKSISSSIIVLAAAILIVGSSYIQHSDTQLFVQIVGCGVGLIGLWGWFVSFKEK